MSNQSRQTSVEIQLPVITPEGKQLALEIANAPVSLEIDGVERDYLVSEITQTLLEQAARELAGIPHTPTRQAKVLELMRDTVELLAQCQEFARVFCQFSDGLGETRTQMEKMRRMVVERVHVRRSDRSE